MFLGVQSVSVILSFSLPLPLSLKTAAVFTRNLYWLFNYCDVSLWVWAQVEAFVSFKCFFLLLFIILNTEGYGVCSAVTLDEKSHTTEQRRPLPSITASVPRGRISSTLPAFTIPVPDSRMSSTLPASNSGMKLSMPGSIRRGFRHKNTSRHGRGRSKHHRDDKPDELMLRVVPIDISCDNGDSLCQQGDLAIDDAMPCAVSEPADDDSDLATWHFQRTARLRQGKYFRKSGKKSVNRTTSDNTHSSTNIESTQQVYVYPVCLRVCKLC